MQVSGKDLEELFRDALLGMTKAAKAGRKKRAIPPRTVALKAPDVTALLVEFLNEALVWMQTELEVYTTVKFFAVADNELLAELRGYGTDRFGEDIKAVTYHEADVRKNAGGDWSTNIIFDT